MYNYITAVRGSCNKLLRRHNIIRMTNCYRRCINSNAAPREAGFGKAIVVLSPFIVVAGVTAYAKYDENFRKSLVKTVPAIEPLLNKLIPKDTIKSDATKKGDELKSKITQLYESKLKDKRNCPESKPKDVSTAGSIKTSATAVNLEEEQPIKDETVKTDIEPKVVESKVPQETIVNLQSITDLEKNVEILASTAIEEYNKAIDVLNIYSKNVKKLIDDSIEQSDLSVWNSLKNHTSARNTAVECAENAAQIATENIEKFKIKLAKLSNQMEPEVTEKVRLNIKNTLDHLGKARNELYNAKEKSQLSELYWKKVEIARNSFINEIESLFPNINLTEKKLNLSTEDLDLFIIHAYSHVLAYQKELQKLQIEGESRLRRAVEALQADDRTEALRSQLDFYLEKEKRDIALDNQKKIFQIRTNAEKELRLQMKRQTEAHADHLQDVIQQREVELKRRFNRELDEKLSTEQATYKIQLAAMLGKLRGMDAALKARADSDKCAHQAQALWGACQALWSSVRHGEPGVSWHNQLRPLANDIEAVKRAAAEGDELVSVVLNSLSDDAKERGVFPQDALMERFLKVEKVARRLALVPEEGAKLPVYLLSYLQSILIMNPSNPITQDELDDKVFDFNKLDTYDILNRARFWMERGDLTQALKYMNLLNGASRKVAKDWLTEARLLLETQQAANILMAHAAASGILYL